MSQDKPTIGAAKETLLPQSAGPTPAPAASGDEVTAGDLGFLSPSQATDEIGRLGSYRILKILGSGGMGVVFLAEDTQLQRQAAVKALLPGLAANADARQRFLREARAAAAIKHDHIVTIYQVGEQAGTPFLAMELLDGEPLEARLLREKVLPVPATLRIGREIADGLAAAHEHGLIHRDVKPANIWLESAHRNGRREFRRVKLLDFGVARSAKLDAKLTQQGAIIGTPAYMAPEQAVGQPVDGRSDLFSLGCVLYRMCTGELPFRGGDAIAVLMAIATEHPVSPAQRNPDIPLALSDLIMRMLAKKPEQRPISARAVIDELGAIEKSLSRGRRSRTAPLAEPTRRPAAPFIAAGAGLAAVAGVAITAFVLTRPTNRPAEPTSAPTPSAAVVGLPSNASTTKPAALSSSATIATVPRKTENQPPPLAVRDITPDPEHPILTGHTGRIFDIRFFPDNRRAVSVAWDGTARIWDVSTGKQVKLFERKEMLDHVAVSRDGKQLAISGTTHKVYLHRLDPDGAGPVIYLDAPNAAALAFSEDGRSLFVASGPGNLFAYQTADGKRTLSQKPLDKPITAFQLLPGGQRAICATSYEPDFVLWDLGKNIEAYRFAGSPPFLTMAADLFADGRRVATINNGGWVRRWSLNNGQEVGEAFHAHFDRAIRGDMVRVLHGDRWLLTTGEDKAIRIWDAGDRKKLFEAKTSSLATTRGDVSPDGRWLVTGGGWRLTNRTEDDGDYDLRVWRLPVP